MEHGSNSRRIQWNIYRDTMSCTQDIRISCTFLQHFFICSLLGNAADQTWRDGESGDIFDPDFGVHPGKRDELTLPSSNQAPWGFVSLTIPKAGVFGMDQNGHVSNASMPLSNWQMPTGKSTVWPAGLWQTKMAMEIPMTSEDDYWEESNGHSKKETGMRCWWNRCSNPKWLDSIYVYTSMHIYAYLRMYMFFSTTSIEIVCVWPALSKQNQFWLATAWTD